ncbi:unnamed protein product [Caenorhabditis nigoni]
MNRSCVDNSQFLSNPEVYKLILHILTCIEIPIHIYGAWCIIFKTSAIMRKISSKLYMFRHSYRSLFSYHLFFMLSLPYH